MEPFYRNEYRNQLEDMFIEKELDSMDDEKALELLLLFSLPIQQASSVAKNLISHFGSLYDVLNADYESLIEIGGTDKDSAVLVALVKDLFNRADAARSDSADSLDGAERTAVFFTPLLRFKKSKSIYAAALNGNFELIKLSEIISGEERFGNKSSQRILDFAKRTKASSLVIAYNEEDESLYPNSDIIQFASNLGAKLNEENVVLTDIVVIGNSSELAFSDDIRLAVLTG